MATGDRDRAVAAQSAVQLAADDERFMREALDQARLAASLGEVPIGAVVVRDGAVIARAHNRRELDEDPSAHAEFAALLAASRELGRWRLSDCTVYVTLEPCTMCAGLMVNARVGRCVYGAADAKAGALGSLYRLNEDARLNHGFAVTAGVLKDECAAVLSDFFAALRERRRASKGAVAAGGADAEQACCCGPSAEAGFDAEDTAEDGAFSMGSHAGSLSGVRAEDAGSCASTLGDEPLGMRRHEEARARAQAEGVAPVAAPVGGGAATGLAPRVLLAVDSFKGSATSGQVEAWIAEGVQHACPGAACTCLPIADGGEGTVEAVRAALSGELREVEVTGPLGGRVQASYLLCDVPGEQGEAMVGDSLGEGLVDTGLAGTTDSARDQGAHDASPVARTCIAVIEMAAAAGITLSDRTHAHALAASTAGVAALALDAIAAGATHLYIGLGGSCTNDGGAGFLRALGARLLDAAGNPVEPGLAGLAQIDRIELAPALAALQNVQLTALTDVTNPLVGARGALAVFGPQKGLCADVSAGPARDAAIRQLDQGMISYAKALDGAREDAAKSGALSVQREGSATNGTTPVQNAPKSQSKRFRSVAGVPGAGAAGGLGAALLAVGAQLTSGIETVLDLINFDAAASQADLVITGEGHMDAQTAGGKAPVGVAARAKRAGKPVVAIVGGHAQDLDAVYHKGVDLVLSAPRAPMSLDVALTPHETRANLVCAGETAIRAHLMGR